MKNISSNLSKQPFIFQCNNRGNNKNNTSGEKYREI